jgi:hypothetical protein
MSSPAMISNPNTDDSMREAEFLLAKRALPDILRDAIETYVSGVKISHNGACKPAKHRAQIAMRNSMRDKGYCVPADAASAQR